MDNELLQNMRELKMNIEYEDNSSQKEDDVQVVVQDITFYGKIEILNLYTKQEETKSIYMVEKNVGNKNYIQFYADNEVIATVLEEENQIVISPKYAHVISAEIFLVKLQELRVQNKEQISLNKLEELEEAKEIEPSKKKNMQRDNKPKNKDEKQEETEEERKEDNYKNDIEINMDAYITVDKKIADIIPEIKEKHCKRVMIRSSNNINFEMYGIDSNGKEIELTSLKQNEGTNPFQEMIKTNTDGTKVETIRVSTMLQIKPGNNEQKGNEGIGIKIGKMGIEEVVYYRRDQNNKYLAVPVGLETTNDKYSTKEVREIATIDTIEEEMLRKAAKERCGGMSVEAFRKIYESAEGETIQEKIDNAVDEVEEQFGERKRE